MSTNNYTQHPHHNIKIPVQEVWKSIRGFKGHYEVSSQGRVRSLARTVPMSDGRKYKVSSKPLTLRESKFGYIHVCLMLNQKGHHPLVHRLVLEAFVGPCPEGMECCHEDGNKSNNHLGNLRWDTRESNRADSTRLGMSHGAHPGENHWNAKLKPKDVLEIRKLTRDSVLHKVIAEKFGVSITTVRDIKSRKSWNHI